MRELRGNMMIGMSEAAVHGTSIVTGKSIVSPIVLNAGTASLNRWAQAKLVPVSGLEQHDRNAHLAFVDQHSAPFDASIEFSIRDRRSLEDILAGFYNTTGRYFQLFFGRLDLSWADPRNLAPRRRINIVPTHAPERPNAVDVNVATEIESDAPSDFALAMDIAFCNDAQRARANTSSDACTTEDHNAAEAIGELPVDMLRALIAQIDAANNAGAGAAEDLRTGNRWLDAWLNQDWERANNALNAAIAIVGVSDIAQQEEQKPAKRKKKRKGNRASVVLASCDKPGDDAQEDAQAESGGNPWQECTARARRQLNAPGAISNIPVVQGRGEYHLRRTPGFDELVRQFRNSGKTLPPGISGEQFGGMTRAIARDAAQTGDNLAIVFLNDPRALGNGNRDRFRFGLEHIWAPGGGGGENGGHRTDWTTLPGLLQIDRQETLVDVIMAALTDPHADYRQERGHNGNVVRTYRRFNYEQRPNRVYTLTNIRIVLGQNGMVITAYPLRGARSDPSIM